MLEANGGKGDRRHPGRRPGAVLDFTPFFQRAKDEKRQDTCCMCSCLAGDHAVAVVAVAIYAALGMRAAGIKLIGPGDIVQDIKLQGMGDAAVGLVTMLTTTPTSTIRRTSASSLPGRRSTVDSTPDSWPSAPTTAWPP